LHQFALAAEGHAMAQVTGAASTSPPPSANLLCTVHNRMRTRRNLIRIERGLWCCKSDQPCLTGKGSQKGGSVAAPNTRRERSPRFPVPVPRLRRSPSWRQRHERRSRSRRRRRRRKRCGSTESGVHRRSRRSRRSRHAPAQVSEPNRALRGRRRRSRSSSRSGTTVSRESSRTPSRRHSPSPRIVAAEAALKAFSTDAADAAERASEEDILDPAGAFSQIHDGDLDADAGRPCERQRSAGSDSDHSGDAAYTNTADRAAVGSSDWLQLHASSPSPDRQLLCKIHGRFRTRRNLRRVPGRADEWCCTPEEPCLLPGQAPPGRQRRGFHQPQPMPASLLEPNSLRPAQRWGAPASSDKDWVQGSPLHNRFEDSVRPSASHSDSIDFTSPDQRNSEDKPGETAQVESSTSIVPIEDKTDPLNLLSLPSPKRSSGAELVLCSSHGKWRHPDRMARKANGDWICTGDDACKISDDPVPQPALLAAPSRPKRGVGRLSTKGPSTLTRIKGIPRLRLRGSALRNLPGGAAPAARPESASRRGRQTSQVTSDRKESRRRQVGRVGSATSSSRRGSSDGTGGSSGTAAGRSRTPRRRARAPPWRVGTRPLRNRATRAKVAMTPLDGSKNLLPMNPSMDESLEGDLRHGRRGSKHKGKGKGRGKAEDAAMSSSTPALGDWNEHNDGRPLPHGTVLCSLHRKPRFPERLEKRGEQWVCKAGDRCRNVDEVKCMIHHRWRTVQNMESVGGGNYTCRPDCECR